MDEQIGFTQTKTNAKAVGHCQPEKYKELL